MPQKKESFEIRLTGKPKPRALLIFMDGTWNDENGYCNDGAITNVYKMFSTLSGSHRVGDIPHQKRTAKHLGLYFRGVGNNEDHIKSIGYYQGAFGAGERNIRDHAYANICKHYRPGDRICIIGYSRGAASASPQSSLSSDRDQGAPTTTLRAFRDGAIESRRSK